jgi:large subunit ribosomal protein L13
VGDFVIVVNAEKVVLTGKKETQKLYSRHSGYPGGLRRRSVREVRATHPERIIENAVRGMLPGNVLGRRQFRKLKVYAGPDHPHATQQPEALLVERSDQAN